MKVKLLKDHLGNKEGDVIDVSEDRANYLDLTGVAKEHKEKKVVDLGPPEKEIIKDKKEKSEKGGTKEKIETKHTSKKEIKGTVPK